MNRAERRRQAKQVARGEITTTYAPSMGLVGSYYNRFTGNKFTNVNDYLDDMEGVIAKQASEVTASMLWDTENYIAAANIIIMLHAVNLAVGNLKTVQKSFQKIMNCYNAASDYVDKVGIREAYEDLHKNYGLEFEFADCDISQIWDDEEIKKRLQFRLDDLDKMQKK